MAPAEPGGGARGPIFVVGAPRSGTSLVRSLLNLDAAVAIAPESHLLDQWLPRHWDGGADSGAEIVARLWAEYRVSAHLARFGFTDDELDRIGAAPGPRELLSTIIAVYADKRGATIAGEKTPAHFRYLARLFEWFPDARVAFVLRDPRAVVASLQALDLRWASGNLASHTRLWRDAAEAALRWRSDPRVTLVRYEDLVSQPAEAVSEMHELLTGRGFDPTWLERLSATSAGSSNGSLTAAQRISDSQIGAWRGRLTPIGAEAVRHACRSEISRLGFDVDPSPAGMAARLRLTLAVLRSTAGRVTRAGIRPQATLRRLRYRHAGR